MKPKKYITILMLFFLTLNTACMNANENSGSFSRKNSQIDRDSDIKLLSNAELRDLFYNSVVLGTTPQGRNWSIHFYPPNKAKIEWKDGRGKNKYHGTWTIRDNYYCIIIIEKKNEQEDCYKVYSMGNNQYNIMKENGAIHSHAYRSG